MSVCSCVCSKYSYLTECFEIKEFGAVEVFVGSRSSLETTGEGGTHEASNQLITQTTCQANPALDTGRQQRKHTSY